MPELLLSPAARTVVAPLVACFRSASGADGSCPWSGNAGAGFLTPRSHRCGLDGPMPHSIAPVLWGRCRPSPDRVSQGAPADRHGGRVVAWGFFFFFLVGLFCSVGAPPGGGCR